MFSTQILRAQRLYGLLAPQHLNVTKKLCFLSLNIYRTKNNKFGWVGTLFNKIVTKLVVLN